MPSHSEIDRDDLLYDRYPLPNNELANYWLRTAFDLIESGMRLPEDMGKLLVDLGVDVPEFVAWAEEYSEHNGYLTEN
jgi:hypothetical protein